jgi:hypothetical protein
MIVVVLSTPKSFHLSSWLIKVGTGYPASHASLHIRGRGLFEGERMVFEATAHGIGLVHPSRWDELNRPVAAYEMVDHHAAGRDAFREMWKSLGVDYDWNGALSFAIRIIIAKLYGVKVQAEDTPDKMFCSELVARWLNRVNTSLGLPTGTLHPDEVSPAGLSVELERSDLFRSVPCEPSLSAIFT